MFFEFDKLLVKTIDKTIRYVVGDQNAMIVYEYLDRISCPLQETPKKLGLFSKALRDLLGTSGGQILGVPVVLEDAIVEGLSSELGLKANGRSGSFEEKIRRLKEKYNNEKNKKTSC